MRVEVPEKKRSAAETEVPPAGDFTATVVKVEELEGEEPAVKVQWWFRAEGKQWTMEQDIEGMESLQDLLVDLGLGGQSVEITASAVNRKALLTVSTYGGRTSAKITDIRPAPTLPS